MPFDQRGLDDYVDVAQRTTAPDDDPWYDNPAPLADLTNPEDLPRTISADQVRSLNIQLTAKSLRTRDQQLGWLRERFGPDVQSSRDLSYSQAAAALQEVST